MPTQHLLDSRMMLHLRSPLCCMQGQALMHGADLGLLCNRPFLYLYSYSRIYSARHDIFIKSDHKLCRLLQQRQQAK